jgi:hypothetical protein
LRGAPGGSNAFLKVVCRNHPSFGAKAIDP